MSRRIVVEALVVVVQLRAEELLGSCVGRARARTTRHRHGRLAGRPRRARRPRSPGIPTAVAARRGVPRRSAGGLRRGPLAGRIVRVPDRLRPRRPDRAIRDRLEVVGRRLLPPTRLLRSGAMTVDPFLLRGAASAAAWRAERGGARAPSTTPSAPGPLPIASGLPLVVTLLDLAPWELPRLPSRTRPRAASDSDCAAQLLRDAAAVIVGSDATARAARRLLRIRRDRLHVVPLAPRAAFRSDAAGDGRGADARADIERLGLAGRATSCYPGRFDARLDLATLLRALAATGRRRDDPTGSPRTAVAAARPARRGQPGRPRLDRARGRAARAISEALAYAPALDRRRPGRARPRRAGRAPPGPLRGGRASRRSRRSPAARRSSRLAVGPLPELVGAAGLLVEPRDPNRLAVALRAAWLDDTRP